MLTPKSTEAEQPETISSIVKKRSIKDLIHFTRMDNLISILNQGILSRNTLDKRGLNYTYNDLRRLDGKLDCSSLSIEYPNNFLFKRFRDREAGSIWVVLIIDASLLVEHKGKIHFCYDNAARSDLRSSLKGEFLTTLQAFENMFCESYTYSRLTEEGPTQGLVTRNAIHNIKSYLPTSSQAEVLVSGDISPKYIKGIVFQTENEIKNFNPSIQLSDNFYYYENGIFITVNSAYFIDRNNVTFNREEN